jgi:hypothetical protein
LIGALQMDMQSSVENEFLCSRLISICASAVNCGGVRIVSTPPAAMANTTTASSIHRQRKKVYQYCNSAGGTKRSSSSEA